MRAVDLGEITHRPPRFVVEWTSGGSARSCARGSQWLWRGLRGRAARPALPAARAAREAPVSVARQLSSVVAGLGRGLGTRLRRASRMVRAWRKSTSLARLCSRPFSVAAAGSATGIAAKSVHPAGISERLPSGSTTSSNATPRRCVAPSACRTRPSKGCRSRRIVTGRGKSRRWVVCGGVLREHSAFRPSQVGGAPPGSKLKAMR